MPKCLFRVEKAVWPDLTTGRSAVAHGNPKEFLARLYSKAAYSQYAITDMMANRSRSSVAMSQSEEVSNTPHVLRQSSRRLCYEPQMSLFRFPEYLTVTSVYPEGSSDVPFRPECFTAFLIVMECMISISSVYF